MLALLGAGLAGRWLGWSLAWLVADLAGHCMAGRWPAGRCMAGPLLAGRFAGLAGRWLGWALLIN